MVLALTLEPSKWVAAGCVAYCAASGWLFAFCRYVDGVEAGVKLKSQAGDAPNDAQPEVAAGQSAKREWT